MIWFIQFLVISLFVRSNIYFGDTAISLLNVINFLAIFYILFSYKRKISKDFIIILIVILFYYFIELIYLIFYFRDIDQIKEFYYSTFIFTLFILIYWGVKIHQIKFSKITFHTIYFIYWIMLFIVLYEIITKHHLPASKGNIDKDFVNLPTAFFYNPNDFATVIALFFPFLYYLCKILNKKLQFKIISILSLFFIIVSLSRVALLLFLMAPLLILFLNNKFKKLFFVTIVFIAIIMLFIKIDFKFLKNESNILNRNANKLLTIIKSPQNDNNTKKVGSLRENIRYSIYKKVFYSPEKYIFGGGFNASGQLYKKGILPLKDPHSYWVEGIIDFGIIGFLPILFLILFPFILSIRYFNKDSLYKYFFIQIFYFLILLNVPSGVMSLPVIWVPIAFFYAFLFNINEYKENSDIISRKSISNI